ncbi:response regulator [Eubacteriales bacterium DFI.9.88]|nr:response regulator [Eubacteriales bacterium DFI.9.88]
MASLNALKLLYIEDDKNTRESLSYYLKKRTGKLISAATGVEALSQYYLHEPELLVVDLLLPDMNGIDVIKEVRQANIDCRIIITSSVEDTDVILKSVDLGIDGYIIKPINPKVLVDKLEASAALYAVHSGRGPSLDASSMSDEKRLKEAAIKKEFLDLIKKKAGRGARDVTVAWLPGTIEIVSYDAYTAIEKTMLGNVRNFSSLEQFRQLFYKTILPDIEEIISRTAACKAELVSARTNVQKQVDKLVFKIFL